MCDIHTGYIYVDSILSIYYPAIYIIHNFVLGLFEAFKKIATCDIAVMIIVTKAINVLNR